MNIILTPSDRAEIDRQLWHGYGSPSYEVIEELERLERRERRRRLHPWVATILGALFVAVVAAAAVGLP